MQYILCKTLGKVEYGDDGYPHGNLQEAIKLDNVDCERIAYSPDQSEVLIRCHNDTIKAADYGTFLTETQAKSLYETWQNEHDVNCKCRGNNKSHLTEDDIDHPCLAGPLCGITHNVIDTAKPEDTTEFDKWKKQFDRKPDSDFEAQARDRIVERKQHMIVEVARTIKAKPSDVMNDLATLTATAPEITAEIPKVKQDTINDAKRHLIRKPIKTIRVGFKQ